MLISELYNVAKKFPSQYRWDTVINFFKDYEIKNDLTRVWFVLEALQSAAWCLIPIVIDNSNISLTEWEINQIYSDMFTYQHNKSIVWNKLILLAQHNFNKLANKDLSLINAWLYYEWFLKVKDVMTKDVLEVKWISGKRHFIVSLWQIGANFSADDLEDISHNYLNTDYQKWLYEEAIKCKHIEWVWTERRNLMSWIILYDFYSKEWNKEKVDEYIKKNSWFLKNLNDKLQKLNIQDNENEKDNITNK